MGRYVIGVTGASGSLLALRLIEEQKLGLALSGCDAATQCAQLAPVSIPQGGCFG